MNTILSPSSFPALLLGAAALFTSCAAPDISTDPATASGFLSKPGQMTEDRERYPFQKVWEANPRDEYLSYSKLYVAPVDIDHLNKAEWYDELDEAAKADYDQMTKDLAVYMQQSVRDAVANYKGTADYPLIQITDKPDSKTIILELAIAEFVPTKKWWNTFGNVAGIVLPGGTAVQLGAMGSIAMEGRSRLGPNGPIVVKFADNEKDNFAYFNLRGMTSEKHAKKNIDEWAGQVASLANTKRDRKVDDDASFELLAL
jgi:hypothetical protein